MGDYKRTAVQSLRDKIGAGRGLLAPSGGGGPTLWWLLMTAASPAPDSITSGEMVPT